MSSAAVVIGTLKVEFCRVLYLVIDIYSYDSAMSHGNFIIIHVELWIIELSFPVHNPYQLNELN